MNFWVKSKKERKKLSFNVQFLFLIYTTGFSFYILSLLFSRPVVDPNNPEIEPVRLVYRSNLVPTQGETEPSCCF